MASTDKLLRPLIRFAHERLGLSPNQVSTVAFLIGILAAGVTASGRVLDGLILMAVSQIIDAVDGGVARTYGLNSPSGEMLEIVYDRLSELSIFLALAYIGEVSFTMVGLAFIAILLVTIQRDLSGFDPGFKRFMIYFGYVAGAVFHIRGFQVALHVVFWANLIGFIVGTIMADYRLQTEIDAQAILRREREREAGIPQPPDDPPSLLSRLFS